MTTPQPPKSSVADLAQQIVTSTGADKPPTHLRIAVVLEVEAAVGRRVKTTQTGDAWIARAEDTYLSVGDRVAMLQTGSTFLVIARLSGEPGAVPIGSVTPFAGSTAPDGWLICDGSAVSRTTYALLFALIGTTYGSGNGTTTFNLPNLTGRFALGVSGSHVQASTGGAETVTLSTSEIPAHTHGSVADHQHGATGDHGHASSGDHGHGSTGDHQHAAVGDHTHPINNAGVTTDVNGTGTTPVASHEPGNTNSGGGHQHGSAGSHSHSNAGSHTHANTGSHQHSGAGGHTHTSVGGGGAHQNMPPFLSLLHIIRAL